ncbi:DUF1801 domain-containing protein [Mucilaginibacter ximonensis]|uniref:DUF1801 domain-containing protein n=1 Tax=Mucilaginibacter ximonensis TaxID=538021 RepID=A0ABW5YEM8_9SPHI
MTTIKTLEGYYLSKPEPYQSCMLALRDIVLNANPHIEHIRKFQIPFFTYRDKKLGYMWLDKKTLKLGFCWDKSLQPIIDGVRPKDKYESMIINPNEDIPIDIVLGKLNYYLTLIDEVR